MATTTAPTATGRQHTTDAEHGDRNRWRWAGGFGLAHIVLMLAALTLERTGGVTHDTSPAKVITTFTGVSTSSLELTTYLEAMAFVPLVAALVLLARLLGRRTETGRLAGQTALALGIAYAASTFAVGFPPLTAAAYAAHHGVDAGALMTVNDIRNYGFVLQVALSVAFALALGVAAIAERSHRTWIGYGGVAHGVAGLVLTPFVENGVSAAWMIWWVGVCVLALRGGPRADRTGHAFDPAA
jgi:hypothetical protein